MLTGFMVLIILGLRLSVSVWPQQMGYILGFSSTITVDEVVNMTNQERSQLGLAPLSVNPLLTQAAIAKAHDMFEKQYWAHTAPDGREPWDFMRSAGYHYQVAGENLARDFSSTGPMISAWMASPTHRDNMVNSRYSQIGVAVVNGVLQGTETTLVVQMFGQPLAAATQETSPEPSLPQLTETAPIPAEAAPQPAETIPSPVETVPQPEDAPSPVETVADLDSQDLLLGMDQAETLELLATETTPAPQVLARAVLPGADPSPGPLISPLDLVKAVFVSTALLLIFVLAYDMVVIGSRRTARLVGKNFAHIMLFLTVAFLIIFFRGGTII